MRAPPQRWEPESCRLTCQGQDPRGAGWAPGAPGAPLEFAALPQSEDDRGVREEAQAGSKEERGFPKCVSFFLTGALNQLEEYSL